MVQTDNIMRGDWLFYRGKVNAFPFQVEQIAKREFGYYAEPEENRMYYLPRDEVFPIPLTEEFMRKNYPDPKEIVWYSLDEQPGFFNIFWEYPTFGEGEVNLNIQYVHELQHILKMIGMTKKIKL